MANLSITNEVTRILEVADATINVGTGANLPDGGTTGQILAKASDADQDAYWKADSDTARLVSFDNSVGLGDNVQVAVETLNDKIGTGSFNPPNKDILVQIDDPWRLVDRYKMNSIESGAQVNPTASQIKSMYEGNQDTNPFTNVEKTKLQGVQAGANDYTHPSTHSADIITETAYRRFFTDTERSKLNGIEENAQANHTPLEIKSIYEGNANTNVFTDAEKAKLAATTEFSSQYEDKLNNIQYGAQVNPSKQTIKTQYEANPNTNSFTDDLLTKLNGIEAGATGDLTGAEIAQRYEAEPNVNRLTDANLDKLTSVGFGADANQTDSEIKTQYERNSNTNAFTDAEKTKLTSVQVGAEVNKTAAEIKSQYEGNADTNAFTDAEKVKLGASESGATANPNAPSKIDNDTIDGAWDFTAEIVTFSSQGAVQLPAGDDSKQPQNASQGMIRYNTTIGSFEGFFGSAWSPIGFGSGINTRGTVTLDVDGNTGTTTDPLNLILTRDTQPNVAPGDSSPDNYAYVVANTTSVSSEITGKVEVFDPSDYVIWTGNRWNRVATNSSNSVTSFAGERGDIIAKQSHYAAFYPTLTGTNTVGGTWEFSNIPTVGGQAVVLDSNYVHTDNNFVDAYKTKLDGFTLPQVLNDPDTVIDAAYVHTDNNFTTVEQTKLTGIETGATADQTGAEIKGLYEAQGDTNAFTDTLRTKLVDIDVAALTPSPFTALTNAAADITGVWTFSNSTIYNDSDSVYQDSASTTNPEFRIGVDNDAMSFKRGASTRMSLSGTEGGQYDIFLHDGTGLNNYVYHRGRKPTPVDIGAVPTTRTVNGQTLSSDIAIPVVPPTRTINTKPLSANVVLSADDVGAVPSDTTLNTKPLIGNVTISLDELNGVPTTRTINGMSLANDIVLDTDKTGLVEDTRTINGHDLKTDVTLSASDVNAEATLDADQKRKITVSADAPTGGSDGDLWIRVI